MVLKTGTPISMSIPLISMMVPFLPAAVELVSPKSGFEFLSLKDMINRGTSKQVRLAANVEETMLAALICPPIQSMVVVTSPMGDQAPPAFAAIIISPENISFNSRS